MELSIVVAMSENRVIGKDNQLPWHLPADLRHFKAVTMGKPILMGRKTHESIGRALPGRQNVVVTRQRGYNAKGCTVALSVDAALAVCADAAEVMVIGGAQLYRELLPRSTRLYLTLVHAVIEGDAFFPEIDPTIWRETGRTDHAADENNGLAFSFVTLQRRTSADSGGPSGQSGIELAPA